MFVPVFADQVVQAVQRVVRWRRSPASPPAGGPLAVTGLWVAAGSRGGVRYQLLRALRAMHQGQMMLVARRLPPLPDPFSLPAQRLALFRALRDVSGWRDLGEVDPLLVPGTAYPGAIGAILLRLDCCAPCPEPHWVPNLRFFFLTERGHQMAQSAEAWWTGLSTRERLRAMLFE